MRSEGGVSILDVTDQQVREFEMTYTPDMPKFTDDVIDSRDVIHWLSELEIQYGPREGEAMDTLHLDEMDDEEREAYEFLCELRAGADGTPDWEYGETIINSDYFTEYQREGLEDCGYLPKDLPGFIERNIDWEGVADDLKADYISFYAGGVEFWVRA